MTLDEVREAAKRILMSNEVGDLYELARFAAAVAVVLLLLFVFKEGPFEP